MVTVQPQSFSARSFLSRHAVTLFAMGVVWTGTLYFARTHWLALYDDAYIYLRYVLNLYAGCGLRFNCDDVPVEGFSSPLYLALLAVGRLGTHHLEALTCATSTLLVGAAATQGLLMLSRAPLAPDRASVRVAALLGFASLLASSHLWLLNSVIGLEAPLGALAVLFLLDAVLRERHVALRVWLVVAATCRPECLLFLLYSPLLPEGRRLKFYLYPVATLLGLTVLRVWVFDELLPLTYFAKSGGTSEHLALGLKYVWQTFEDFPLSALAPLACFDARIRRRVIYLLAVTLTWYAFFLRTGGDTFYYSRLAVPLILGLELLAIHGLCWVGARLARKTSPFATLTQVLTILAPVGGVAGYSRVQQWLPPTHEFANVGRYKAVGRYLAKNHPGARVATVPIGAISYFSGLHVLDLVGLTAPAIAHAGTTVPEGMLDRKWIGHERHNTPWVLEQAPGLIVTTKFRSKPWRTLDETSAGFIADWLLLRAIKAGEAPYRLLSAEVEPGLHCLMFERTPK